MFERFSDRARKVMTLANQEAQRFRHEHIGPEHMLLGLIKEGSGVGVEILKALGVDLEQTRLAVEKLTKSGPSTLIMGKLPQTPTTKKVVGYAIEEARNLNDNHIGTEHILLGLLREQGGGEKTTAFIVLTDHGVALNTARAALLTMLGKRQPEPPTRGEPVALGEWDMLVTISTPTKIRD